MASNYAYNTGDIKFILKEWLPTEEIFAYDKYKNYFNKNDLDMLIDTFYKMSMEVIAPTNDDGETTGVKFKDGKVYLPESFKKLFKYIQTNGWGTSNIDRSVKGTIPCSVYSGLLEMMGAANPAFFLYIVLTNGTANLIQLLGDEPLKKLLLPKMMDVTWSGTMCLTEPSDGSDVGDILSKAYPTEDSRIYNIKGNKIFITGGDGDHVENIIHLYLARIDGAKPGTRGISLFVVPKYWINDDGSLVDNDVQTIGIEHKLGLKGTVTAALAFGQNNGCRGWLLGNYNAKSGQGQGMAQMFQLMNQERVNSGILALAITANAYWNAVAYCKERVQGRLITNPGAGRAQIINHEDVKRMLLLNKAATEACRAILMKTAYYNDVAHYDHDPERRKWARGIFECLVPIAKAYPADEGWPLICESMQAYGGYGYCEDYPVARAARDVKICSIWEGTNFIQSMDLVGRKWVMENGAVFDAFLKEIEDFIEDNQLVSGLEKEFDNLERALKSYKEIRKAIGVYLGNKQVGIMAVFARRILTATAQLLGGYYLLDQALISKKAISTLETDHHDYNFYKGKIISARYYLRNVVPNVWAVLNIITDGDTSVIDACSDIFQY